MGLPPQRRLASSRAVQQTVRQGRRCGSRLLVVHAWIPRADDPDLAAPVAQAGFVVSKAVGSAVVRHRVTRRLRALLATRLAEWPPGTRLVIRALPAAATAGSDQLAADLDRCLRRLSTQVPA